MLFGHAIENAQKQKFIVLRSEFIVSVSLFQFPYAGYNDQQQGSDNFDAARYFKFPVFFIPGNLLCFLLRRQTFGEDIQLLVGFIAFSPEGNALGGRLRIFSARSLAAIWRPSSFLRILLVSLVLKSSSSFSSTAISGLVDSLTTAFTLLNRGVKRRKTIKKRMFI